MKIEAQRSARKCRGGAAWRAVTLVVLLSFSLQSYITQTHLHAIWGSRGTQVALQAPHSGHVPFDEGAATCPFCQATIHAGAFFAPTSPVFVLPASSIGFAVFAPIFAAHARAPAHAWYSRGPPQSGL